MQISRKRWRSWSSAVSSAGSSIHYSWAGRAFERVCMQHVNQIKAAIGFSAVVSSVHSWSYKGTKDPITGKTAAQVALRWLIIIPKTVHKERIQENMNLFDFELDADDMQKIAALDTAHSLFLDHHDGETTKQFMEWRAVVKPKE